MKHLAFALACALLGACGVEDDGTELAPMTLEFALPVDCAAPPADLEAVAWISGNQDPEPLQVDVDAGTTTGQLQVTRGLERRVVIDWFVTRAFGGGDVRVVLGQARERLDLTEPTVTQVPLEIAPEDVDVTDCVDVTGDTSRQGVETVSFDGADRPVCDLDDSCAGSLAPECANVGEICAGEDPLTL
jgi:hypothetical protein